MTSYTKEFFLQGEAAKLPESEHIVTVKHTQALHF